MKEAICHNDTDAIDTTIKEILSRGKVVVFTNVMNGVVKKVNEWNPDDMGDLTAFESTGVTKYVCPYAVEYTISEE